MTFPGYDHSAGRRRSALSVVLLILASLVAIGVVAALVLRDRDSASTDVATGDDATAPASDAASCSPGANGQLREDTQFTAASGLRVPFSISFPADYYSACRAYPVLYVLHGRDSNNVQFMSSALQMRRAMDAGALNQAIIVTPDSFSTGRWENRDTGPAEDNLIKYLIPHVEQTYRVEPGASHRLLAGFSMGGHGALRLGLKYPHMFAGVWSVDGAMSRQPADYLKFVEGRSSEDFHIIAVGGQLNGSRVQTVIDTLQRAGITIPYTYQDREHTFGAFVAADEKADWHAARFLQQQLGRPM